MLSSIRRRHSAAEWFKGDAECLALEVPLIEPPFKRGGVFGGNVKGEAELLARGPGRGDDLAARRRGRAKAEAEILALAWGEDRHLAGSQGSGGTISSMPLRARQARRLKPQGAGQKAG